jgi:membrane-associated HD superfamily phosphohydrolase
MTQTWQLIHLQMKSQSDAVTNLYTTVKETLKPIIQSIQTISNVMKRIKRNLEDKDEQQLNENASTVINDTMATLTSRLQLLEDPFQKINNLIEQQNVLMERGMNSTLDFSNDS